MRSKNKRDSQQDRAYLAWRCRKLYRGDVVRVVKYIGYNIEQYVAYTGRVLKTKHARGEWSITVRASCDIETVLHVSEDIRHVCLVRRIDIVRER